jgi:hypothetical protein
MLCSIQGYVEVVKFNILTTPIVFYINLAYSQIRAGHSGRAV